MHLLFASLKRQLVSALRLSQADASAIIRYRTEHGAFRDWGDLSKIGGVDLKQLEAQRDKLVFSAPAADRK